jgi:hypothetical protein
MLFCAQLIASYEWQPAQLSATCKWHNQPNFRMKKHGEIHFQKEAAFCLSCEKAVSKHVDEIDASVDIIMLTGANTMKTQGTKLAAKLKMFYSTVTTTINLYRLIFHDKLANFIVS